MPLASSPFGIPLNHFSLSWILHQALQKLQEEDSWAVGHCYTVINNMIITPISPTLGLSILKNLKVPFYDVINCIVNVGREEVTQCNIFYKFSPLHWSFCNLYRDFKASCHKNFGLHYRLLSYIRGLFLCQNLLYQRLSWSHSRILRTSAVCVILLYLTLVGVSFIVQTYAWCVVIIILNSI